jgi:SAM-dependent methyltransferase
MAEMDARAPYLPENLWGYGKRLQFVDSAIRREFPGKKRSELSVLDIGGGNGSQLAIPLADSGYQVTATDPHQPSIERGRAFATAVEFHHGSVSDLSPTKFDCLIISEVLEHLHDPELLLRLALPYLSESGILVITVPNGYGEFELDRRLYRALQADKMAGWLRSMFKRGQNAAGIAGSDDNSPHVQRFTLSSINSMFISNHLQVLEARATSAVSGPFIAHLFGKSQIFARMNASVSDHLPLPFVAGWMFCLRRAR